MREPFILPAPRKRVNSRATKLLWRPGLWPYNLMRATQCLLMTTQCVLSPADYRRMPWKNGGGNTTEIATFPAGSDFASFAWRVSIAEVLRDGPFSPFPGVDRTLVLLAGGGMRLTGEDAPIELRTAFAPIEFSGDTSLQCSLLAGPVRDFNLMLRRGMARGNLIACRDGGGPVVAADTYVCYAAAGAAECTAVGHPPIALAPFHTLVVTSDAGTAAPVLRVRPLGADVVTLVAAIQFT
jgi:environmental stress-induced protein Ves